MYDQQRQIIWSLRAGKDPAECLRMLASIEGRDYDAEEFGGGTSSAGLKATNKVLKNAYFLENFLVLVQKEFDVELRHLARERDQYLRDLQASQQLHGEAMQEQKHMQYAQDALQQRIRALSTANEDNQDDAVDWDHCEDKAKLQAHIRKLEQQMIDAQKILEELQMIEDEPEEFLGVEWESCGNIELMRKYIMFLRKQMIALKAQAADVNNRSDDDVRKQLRKARQLIEKLLNAKSDQHKATQTDASTQPTKKKSGGKKIKLKGIFSAAKKMKSKGPKWAEKLAAATRKDGSALFDFARNIDPKMVPKISSGNLIKTIFALCAEKIEADRVNDSQNIPRRSMEDFLGDFFLNKFGLLSIAQRNLAQFLIALKVRSTGKERPTTSDNVVSKGGEEESADLYATETGGAPSSAHGAGVNRLVFILARLCRMVKPYYEEQKMAGDFFLHCWK